MFKVRREQRRPEGNEGLGLTKEEQASKSFLCPHRYHLFFFVTVSRAIPSLRGRAQRTATAAWN